MCDKKGEVKNDNRPLCKYGVKCYQTNKNHIEKFKHPDKDKQVNSPPKKIPRLSNDNVKEYESPNKREEKVSSNSPDKHKTRSPKIEEDIQATSSKIISSTDLVASPNVTLQGAVTSSSTNIVDTITGDIKKSIKDKFLVEMPDDFYSFWEFCKSIAKGNNLKNVLKTVNLFLVGPFDLLLGELPERENELDYLVHWRYYYDPPEFQTILMSPDAAGYHLGYFRDSPDDLPCFVASNEAEKSCKISPVAENIFGAVFVYLENYKKKSPFSSIFCHKTITQLKEWATKNNISLDVNSSKMKKRKVTVVSNTFHGAGIVVPFDKKTSVGYRPLTETDAKLKTLIQKVTDCKNEKDKSESLASLESVITYANIATDECDFGSGLELGIDFFTTGDEVFHNSIKQLLSIAYSMLNREDFNKILDAHLKNRRKGSKLSCADL